MTQLEQARLVEIAADAIASIINVTGAAYGGDFAKNHGRDAILNRARAKTAPRRARKPKASEVSA